MLRILRVTGPATNKLVKPVANTTKLRIFRVKTFKLIRSYAKNFRDDEAFRIFAASVGKENFGSFENERKKKKRSFLILLLVIASLIGAAVLVVATNQPNYSISFFGQSREFQRNVENIEKFPFGTIAAALYSVMVYEIINRDSYTYVDKFLSPFYSDYAIALAFKASLEYIRGDVENAKKNLARAHQVMEEKPEINAATRDIIPKSVDDFYPKPYAPTRTEISPDVFTVLGPHVQKTSSTAVSWIEVQATVIKNSDNSVTIINPTSFDENTINWINSLGTVKTLITTALGHGRNIATCSTIWPNATIYGTDKKGKHNQPQLNWKWLDEDEIPELVAIPIQGNLILESAVYHVPSKTLHMTDFIVHNQYKRYWNGMIYTLALGMHRGTKSEIPLLDVFSYHYFFTTDYSKVKESLQKVLDLDIDTLVIGHGGIVKDPKVHLENAVKYFVNPSPPSSSFERFCIKAKWMYHYNVAPLIFAIIKLNLGLKV